MATARQRVERAAAEAAAHHTDALDSVTELITALADHRSTTAARSTNHIPPFGSCS
ncbi:hypothetical protein [Streptomyces natalensis]|uniref:hypothetical protein n=1 Tax=Streptomyces natalensis TaxID=68242 RepID=UPI000A6CBC8D|nr:hypothetical protein [Streptomyces natalensis]